MYLQILDNQVVNVRTRDKEGYWGLQVGGVNHPKPKNVSNLSLKLGGASYVIGVHVQRPTLLLASPFLFLCRLFSAPQLLKPILGQYLRAGVVPKRKLWEFRVTEDAVLPVGTSILAAHFVCGQYVDVCAKRYIYYISHFSLSVSFQIVSPAIH